jgi:DNA polymerase-3 subunit epsilon
MGLFSKKVYPEIWENYAKSFKSKTTDFSQVRFVIFDTETTGLNVNEDCILSIGAIAVSNQQIHLNDVFERFVAQEKFSRDTVEIHGIRKSIENKVSEEEAILHFLAYIENAVLVGHHIGFDIAMINQGLHRLGLPKLKNTVLDTGSLHLKTFVDLPKQQHFSLDELSYEYRIPMHDRHNSSGDAYITAQLFLKILNKLQKNNPLSISYLKRSAKRTGLL